MQELNPEDFKTAQQIADELGVNKATINRHAKAHALGTAMGATQTRYFSKTEIAKLKRVCRLRKGNPNFSKKS